MMIYAELTGDSKKQRIKSLCDNNLYVEKGTRRMRAQPFLKPALDAERPKLISNLRKIYEK